MFQNDDTNYTTLVEHFSETVKGGMPGLLEQRNAALKEVENLKAEVQALRMAQKAVGAATLAKDNASLMMEVAGLKEEVIGLEIEQVEMAKTFAKAVANQEERYEPAGGEKYGSKTARVAKDVN